MFPGRRGISFLHRLDLERRAYFHCRIMGAQMPTYADSPKTLTARQQRFVEACAAGESASKAARVAGYRDAKNEGYRLAHRPHIQAAIQKRLREALANQEDPMTPEEVIIRLTRRARSSMDPFVGQDEQGRVRLAFDTEEAREAMDTVRHFQRRTIEHADGIEVVEELEVHDALPALRLLGELYGFGEGNLPNTKAPAPSPMPTSPNPDTAKDTPEEARVKLAEILGIPVDILPPADRDPRDYGAKR